MKHFKKTLALAVACAMAFSVAACGPKATNEGSNAEGEAPATGLVLKIYNSKGENAAQFTQMVEAYSAETGVAVDAFSIGSGQDHMEPLRAEMSSKNPPVIFSIQGLKELAEWKEGGFVLDFSTVEDPEFKALADAIAPGLRLTDDGANSYGVPYNVEGYGYIVDTQMLSDLFGGEDVNTLVSALQAASYQEWEAFIRAVNTYIQYPTNMTVTLDRKPFTLAETKTGLAQQLTGVFAVMGSQKWTYGDHFVNVALNAAFANPAEAHKVTDEGLDELAPLFEKYAQGLDLKTSFLAGANGPAKRGPDFVSEANFGYDQTVQIFSDSKALFLKQGNWAYGNIANVNPEMAQRLVFLPVKLPIAESDIQVSGLTVDKFNSSIPVFVPNYYAINAKVSPELQKEAMKFLVWLNTSDAGKAFIVDSFAFIPYNADPAETQLPNALGNSILSYMQSGNTLAAPYQGAPPSWAGDTLGLKMMESYMTKETWTPEDYKDIAAYAIQSWKDLRQ